MNTNVILTGSTGLLGSALVYRLIDDPKINLIPVVRPKGPLRGPERLQRLFQRSFAHVLNHDVTDLAEYKGSIDGRNLVLHAAAEIKDRDPAALYRTNVEGTRSVINFCKQQDADALIYVSTAYSCGQAKADAVVDHRFQGETFNNEYEKTKRMAEDLVRRSGIPYTICRPSILVKEHQKLDTKNIGIDAWFDIIGRLVQRSKQANRPLFLMGRQQARFDCVSLDGVADEITHVIHKHINHGAKGLCYLMTAGQQAPTAEQVVEVARQVFHYRDIFLSEDPEKLDNPLSKIYQRLARFYIGYTLQSFTFQSERDAPWAIPYDRLMAVYQSRQPFHQGPYHERQSTGSQAP